MASSENVLNASGIQGTDTREETRLRERVWHSGKGTKMGRELEVEWRERIGEVEEGESVNCLCTERGLKGDGDVEEHLHGPSTLAAARRKMENNPPTDRLKMQTFAQFLQNS